MPFLKWFSSKKKPATKKVNEDIPNQAKNALRRARTFEDQDNLKAIEEADRAIELAPSWPLAYTFRGEQRRKLGQFELAIQDYDQAIAIDPQPYHFFFRGRSNAELGSTRQAIDDYGKAITLDPTHADYYNSRAVQYDKLGKWERARADYDTAIRLDPDEARFYYNRAGSFLESDNFVSAIEDYSRAIERGSVSAFNNRAICHQKLGNEKQAIADYTEAISHQPDTPEPYVGRADCYHECGELGRARADLQKVEQLSRNRDDMIPKIRALKSKLN